MKTNKLVKPFLKWAGGKRQLVPEIKANHLPEQFNTYYEPFLGGGALFLDLQPQHALVSDSNSELINCYQIIKDSVDELIEELSQHKNEREYYYDIRDWDRSRDIYNSKTPVQRASRIIFLNKTCYNGLFRVNSQGQFNVPFGKYKRPNILDTDVLRAVSNYLNTSQVKILNTDFQTAVESAKKGDFVYFDPPYDPISDTASFTGYDINRFKRDEQKRLKETVDDLTARGCKVLVSNACTDFILDLYEQNYIVETVAATRAINSNALKRGKVDEVLIRNYAVYKTPK